MRDRVCSIKGCRAAVFARGLCQPHYTKQWKAQKKCAVRGCSKPRFARGLCWKHYDYELEEVPHQQYMRERSLERFWANVNKRGPVPKCCPRRGRCWLWKGYHHPRVGGEYGRYVNGEKQTVSAHCFAYELLVGPIPAGLKIDHLCRNPLCVNPDHLEPVTDHENVVVRGTGPSAVNALKTHCVNGHEFTPANTYHPPKRPTNRHCRICMRETQERFKQRKNAS